MLKRLTWVKTPDHEPLIETFGTLYPNFYISASSQSIEIAYVLPDGPGESVQRVSYHFQRDVALAPEAYEERKVVHDFFYEAFMEDGTYDGGGSKSQKFAGLFTEVLCTLLGRYAPPSEPDYSRPIWKLSNWRMAGGNPDKRFSSQTEKPTSAY